MDSILVKGNGPILITAPHTVKTNRHYTNKTQIHEAENFIYHHHNCFNLTSFYE